MTLVKITFSALATADLEEIADYITSGAGASVALGYLARLRIAVNGLADFPEMGVPRPEIAQDVRLLSFERRVAVLYRTDKDNVLILRVLSGGQALPDAVEH